MKKILFFTALTIISLTMFSQHQQIENSDFEFWTGSTADNWNSQIDVAIPIPPYTLTIYTSEQSTDAVNGNYSSKLETKSYSDGTTDYIVPGLTQLGILTFSGGDIDISGGDSLYDRPLGIRVFMKYAPADGDTAFVIAYMTKYHNDTGTRDTVGGIIYTISDPVNDYTEYNIPILYKDTTQGDTINIMFISSSPFDPKVGSILFVDSLELMYNFVAYPTLALPATEITDTSFTANWTPSPLASQYYLDVATDSAFTNIITGYDNILLDTFFQSVVIPGAFQGADNYYYRVRVNYGDTATSISSNVMEVYLTYPAVALAATNITQNSFDANWASVTQAESYNLEVAYDMQFTSLVPGYESLNTTDTTYTVSGLTAEQAYYYRVQTVYSFGDSPYSNIIATNTLKIKDIKEYYDYFIENQVLYLNQLKPNSSIAVYDMNGRLVTKINSSSSSISIPLEISGIYFIVITNNTESLSFKISL